MEIQRGRVIGGRVVLDGEPLAEESLAAVVSREGDDAFDVSPADVRALVAAIAEADSNDVVPWDQIRTRSPVP